MNRTVASSVEILTWINKRLTDHPACAGFILDGVLTRWNAETIADPTWELGMMRDDAGPPSRDCLLSRRLRLKILR
jgi:hypothetical protein